MRSMDTAPTTTDPLPLVLDLEGVQDRYRIGRTKAVEPCATEAFPKSVVPGMHRYAVAALEAWELSFALAGTVAEPVAPPPVLVTPPQPGRPGRRPSKGDGAR